MYQDTLHVYHSTEMGVANDVRWLLLVFGLPAKFGSKRVQVWRKLKRIGALPLGSSGYLLPFTSQNHEHFEWLAASIRKSKGQASVIQVESIDELPPEELVKRFTEARSRDYEGLSRELKKLVRSKNKAAQLARLRRRFQEISAVDFFNSPLRDRLEASLERAAAPISARPTADAKRMKGFQGRTWVTRPRPGIDRTASAWLITRFIDPHAHFVFATDPKNTLDAVPFDMFQAGGFGHQGDDCTFETLRKEFGIRDRKVAVIAEIIHDADLDDEKFGRVEGIGLDKVLIGWAQQGLSDEELLRRGTELIEGLYRSVT
jgi:hypothetical protein